jgi:hypothetical protein
MKIGESKAILEAMGGEQGGDAVDVAQAEDETDDGLRSDGVKAGGRRIVEHDGRTGDQGAGDRDAATHAAGEFGGKQVAGVAKFDEAEDFFDARSDLVFVETIFLETVGDVFTDCEGVEEGTFLEDKADLAAGSEKFGFGQVGDVLVENAYGARIGAEETCREFEKKSFAGAGFAEEDDGFALLGGERDTTKNFAFGKTEADIVEFNGSLAGVCESCRETAGIGFHERSEKLISEIEREFREKGVRDDDKDGGDNDGLGGGADDALRAAADVEALIAAHRGN